jgi:hypothetical protein
MQKKIFAECLTVGTRQRVTAVTYVRLYRVPGFAECFSLSSAALGKEALCRVSDI